MRWLSLTVGVLLCGFISAQQAPSPSPAHGSSVTIKRSARVVVLDAIVTDKSGKPVQGLKAQDFTVLEDGKPQQLRGFEERGPEINQAKLAAVPELPANTYTNYISEREPGAVNIILFDSLNTDRQNLVRARQQLLLYLSKMPPQSKVALFTLDGELHLVHGFTQDTSELTESAQQLSSYPNPMMRKAREVTEDKAMAAEVIKSPKVYRAMARLLWTEYDGKADSRTLMTVEALNQLARSLAVVPGRKNLIWISGGIPFDPTSTAPQIEKTASLLAATQIAVYPIDVRGVPWLGADGAARSSEVFGLTDNDYAHTSGQADELEDVRQTMREVARLTGGRAYYNSNDMPAALQDIVDSGSHYYTLAYRPQNNQWDGRFRKVTVKVARADAKVRCRPGYNAVADPFGTPDIDRSFAAAMQPAVPPSTALIIKAQVLPPDAPDKAALIDYLVDLHDLTLIQSADDLDMADVMFVASAWSADGKPSGSVTATFHQPLDAATLKSLMRKGLRLHQEMQLKPGTYQLRLGVVDRLSGKIGTLDVPLKVEPKVARNTLP